MIHLNLIMETYGFTSFIFPFCFSLYYISEYTCIYCQKLSKLQHFQCMKIYDFHQVYVFISGISPQQEALLILFYLKFPVLFTEVKHTILYTVYIYIYISSCFTWVACHFINFHFNYFFQWIVRLFILQFIVSS